MLGFVREYLDAGWEVPFPIATGQKYPPAYGVTGKIPRVRREQVEKLWEDAGDNPNVGIRMQVTGNYDVISLDVDHYDTKRGRDFLDDLMMELGDLRLESVPRSTRRGPRSMSAQYFFRVPKGNEWDAKACPDVDIVQMGHRYSAVWPSVVEGERYQWYQGDDEIPVPHVRDLPVLPDKWVNHLIRSKKGRPVDRERKALSGFREAIEWIRENIAGWDLVLDEAEEADATMSPAMRNASMSERFLEDLENNAHDSMVSAIHSSIMLAVEGHHGLKPALFHIRKAFLKEVSGTRRKRDEAEKEYERAVVGEVEKLASDVEAGVIKILDSTKDMSMPNFMQLFVPAEAEKRPLGVDWQEYGNTDRGHAMMFKDFWDRDVLVTNDNSNQEFAAWMTKTGRYSFRNANQMFKFIEHAVCMPLDYEASKLDDFAAATDERADNGQLGSEEKDSDEYRNMAAALRNRANLLRNTRPAQAMMKQLHSIDEISVNLDDFDNVPGIIGAKNGKTLDLNLLAKGEDPVRDSVRSDMLTMSTAVSVQSGAKHEKWDEFLEKFLPNKEIRDFAQKVFGYCLVDNNPSKLMIFLWGPSNTGKTTILEAIAKALGDYAAPMSANKLFGHHSSSTNPELVSAIKKRMVILSEVGDGHRLSSNAIKQITGNDLQQARNNHSNHIVNAVPQFTPYASTNNPPEISHADAALKNRILVLPFDAVHPPERVMPEDDLKENREISSAILWWLIEGCKKYIEEGLERETWPDKVKDLSEEFVTGTSSLQRFIERRIERDPKSRAKLTEVFQAWKTWCISEGMDQKEVGSKSDLKKALSSNGFKYMRNTSFDGVGNIEAFGGMRIK